MFFWPTSALGCIDKELRVIGAALQKHTKATDTKPDLTIVLRDRYLSKGLVTQALGKWTRDMSKTKEKLGGICKPTRNRMET